MTLARKAEERADSATPSNGTGGVDATELREVISSLFSDENINLKTVLNQEQVVALATALAFAERYNVTLIVRIAMLLMQLKVSEKARGRVDMRSVLMSFLGRNEQDDLKDFQKLLR